MDQQGLEDMFSEMELAAKHSPRRAEPSYRTKAGTTCRTSDDPEDLFGRSLAETLVKASRTGKLNVANMGLEIFPRELWTGVLGLSEEDLGPDPAGDKEQKSRLLTDVFSGESGFGESDLPPHVLSKQASSETKRRLDEVPFYEREDMTVIRASGNMLKVIDSHIGMFGALRTLDVSFRAS